jgi:hypothetical protein
MKRKIHVSSGTYGDHSGGNGSGRGAGGDKHDHHAKNEKVLARSSRWVLHRRVPLTVEVVEFSSA